MTAAGFDANLAAYVTFAAILAITPGGTTAVVVRNTLWGGRRVGIATALGAATTNITYATLAGLGLSVLLTHWPAALVGIRILGAAFLTWLGVQSLWGALTSADGGLRFENGSPIGHDFRRAAMAQGFREGLIVNLVNPTIITFYVAIVPTFVPAGAPRFYFGLLAAIHVSIALVCHTMWAIAFHGLRRWLASTTPRRILAAATGVALILLALRVLL